MIGTTLGHYRISGKLGEGGMGAVYRATDTKLGRDVALKVLPPDMAAKPELVERFRREARTVAALNHPHIVTIYAVEEVDGVHFLAMEVVEGHSLDRLMSSHGLPVDRILAVATAIADALAAAHDKGIVHRDLKPANVMEGQDGRVKILDFGLAKIADDSTVDQAEQTALRTRDGVVLGTLPYMSPEQVTGRATDHRTDLFSLGVILYEMAAGRRPFAGRSSAELASAILRDTPRPLADVRPDFPSDLARIIRRCLEKVPDQRIQTARDLFNELRDLGSNRLQTAIIEIPIGPTHASAVTGPVDDVGTLREHHATVGRERERRELATAFQRAKGGRGSLVCLSGEPGIGKTTLVERFITELSGERYYVARGRCSERLAGSEAYLPLVDALESLLRDQAFHNASSVMKAVAPTWYSQVAPVSTGSGESGSWPSASSSQERMKREFANLLQEASRSRPLVLFIDDLQWADVSTIDVVSFLAAKLESLCVLLVVTYRLSDMLLANHPFLQIKPDLQARGVCRELTLGFLSEAEVGEYVAREFPGHRFPSDLPRLIHAKTEGSPLFMVDLVGDLRDRGAIERTSAGWALGHALSDIARDLPESVRGMIERKIAQLSDADRQLLVAASVQGHEFDSAVVAKVLSLEADVVEQRLETLERVLAFVQLMSEVELPDGTVTLRYRFVHVLYQNALYASLRPTRRASLNGLVAAALVGFHGKRTPDIAAQLAILHAAARNYPAAVEQYLQAAQQATRVFGHAEAARLAESGLRLIDKLPDTPERTRAELRLRSRLAGSQMVLKGYGAPDVLATHLRMRELCLALGDDAQRLRAELGLSIVHTVRAEYEKARELAAGSLDLAESIGDSAMAVQADFCQGLGSFYLGRLSDARQQFQRSLDRYDPARHRSIALYGAVLNRAHLSRTLYWLGYPDSGAALMRDALAASDETRHPIGQVNTLSVAVFVEILEGRVHALRATSERMMALAEEHGYPYYRAIGLVVGGLAIALETGDEGIAQMRQGLAMHEAAATWQNHATYLILLADALRATGRMDEALSTLVEAEAAISRTGERYYEPELHRLRGMVLLAHAPDSVHRAEASFRQAIEIARHQEARSWELRAATSLVRLLRQRGHPADAEAGLKRVVEWFSEGLETAELREAKALVDGR